ncbi:putative nuclear RNA export factor SDE5 [Vitis vinifera]|uniref:Putative nuclear RNA export factor SDE5 n=1 Tax=Vitis vinifera TaxID=29760 RepID=A0A438DR25_VITVI|nr:putative nuclear RNA export factor SDE5 [Vitis vinifera]
MGQRKSEYMTGDRRILNTKEPELPGEKGRRNLQKEVLAALFTTSERPEELPARTAKPRPVRKSRVAGNLVLEPFKDVEEYKIDDLFSKQIYEDDGEEDDSYQDLRQAVKEYRTTMKEYYKAAVNAFANGDRVKADKLLEKGHFFHNKAREADEESARKIFETRNVETEDEMSLDLHAHDAKEAILILKSHLSSLSGIPSIKFLKVIMETGEENISKGGARKRLIMKLLEKHSIKWTEGSNAGIILIRVDEINPQRLSFARK